MTVQICSKFLNVLAIERNSEPKNKEHGKEDCGCAYNKEGPMFPR